MKKQRKRNGTYIYEILVNGLFLIVVKRYRFRGGWRGAAVGRRHINLRGYSYKMLREMQNYLE